LQKQSTEQRIKGHELSATGEIQKFMLNKTSVQGIQIAGLKAIDESKAVLYV